VMIPAVGTVLSVSHCLSATTSIRLKKTLWKYLRNYKILLVTLALQKSRKDRKLMKCTAVTSGVGCTTRGEKKNVKHQNISSSKYSVDILFLSSARS
jgi:hypothetical protein